jgi:hypothetical protein
MAGAITVHSGVTSLGSSAFSNTTAMTSCTLPATVTSIGSYAFYYASSLSTLNILATTAPTFGSNVFFQVNSLTEIHVPTGATGYPASIEGKTVVFDL